MQELSTKRSTRKQRMKPQNPNFTLRSSLPNPSYINRNPESIGFLFNFKAGELFWQNKKVKNTSVMNAD
jgi:hypothetical protein